MIVLILLDGGEGPARVKMTMLLRHGGAPSVAVERIHPVHHNPQPIGARNPVVEIREAPQER